MPKSLYSESAFYYEGRCNNKSRKRFSETYILTICNGKLKVFKIFALTEKIKNFSNLHFEKSKKKMFHVFAFTVLRFQKNNKNNFFRACLHNLNFFRNLLKQ